MTRTAPSRDHARAVEERVADSYRAQGYEVELGVPLEGSDLGADLIARRGDDVVLIQVKHYAGETPGASLRTAAEIAARRGWRFVVVPAGSASEPVEVLPQKAALALVEDAARLDASSWIAPIAALAAFEAAARVALVRAGVRALPRPGSESVLQALASQGLVTPADEQFLRGMIAVRNAAAHGLRREGPPADEVQRVLSIARALAEETPAAA